LFGFGAAFPQHDHSKKILPNIDIVCVDLAALVFFLISINLSLHQIFQAKQVDLISTTTKSL
jgi:hypothetical protein